MTGISLAIALLAVSPSNAIADVVEDEAPTTAELYRVMFELNKENQQLKDALQEVTDRAQPTANPSTPAETSANDGDDFNGRLFLNVDHMILSFYQEGGTTDATGGSVDLDWKFAPRFEGGYMLDSGWGIRGRGFLFDHTSDSSPAGGTLGVDTYTVDGELFKKFQPSKTTEVEVAGGIRVLDFKQRVANDGIPSSIKLDLKAIGGTVALEGRRSVAFRGIDLGNIVIGARESILLDDADITNSTPFGVSAFSADNSIVSQTELSMGWEYNHQFPNLFTLTAGVAAEWQLWTNVGIADTSFGGIGNDDILEDVGFWGLKFSIGLAF